MERVLVITAPRALQEPVQLFPFNVEHVDQAKFLKHLLHQADHLTVFPLPDVECWMFEVFGDFRGEVMYERSFDAEIGDLAYAPNGGSTLSVGRDVVCWSVSQATMLDFLWKIFLLLLMLTNKRKHRQG